MDADTNDIRTDVAAFQHKRTGEHVHGVVLRVGSAAAADGQVANSSGRRPHDQATGAGAFQNDLPEVSLALADDLDEAIALFNQHSPRLAASLISENAAAQARFYAQVDAAFVGDGMTRWVDGQYALNRPELGLSNWEHGRLLARGGVLSGDSVYTIRTRMRQKDIDLHR